RLGAWAICGTSVACDRYRGVRVSPARGAAMAVELPPLWRDRHHAGIDRARRRWSRNGQAGCLARATALGSAHRFTLRSGEAVDRRMELSADAEIARRCLRVVLAHPAGGCGGWRGARDAPPSEAGPRPGVGSPHP